MTNAIVFKGDADASPMECVTVRVPGGMQRARRLGLRLNLANHSPTGFGWGYGGSGPAQLALAILVEVTGDTALSLRLYQQFKWDVISKLAMDQGWTLPADEVLAWLARQPDEAAA